MEQIAPVFATQQGALGGSVGIAQFNAHEKTVQLRFGQRKGTDLVRRVLRGDDEKRGGQLTRFTFDGDLMLFHGFEQRALRLGCGAVDFVGKHHLRKNGSGVKLKLAALAVVDCNAEHVCRQQIAGELYALKGQPQGTRKCMRQCGFSNARHILDQQVTARDQTRQCQADLPFLTQNYLTDLRCNFIYFYHMKQLLALLLRDPLRQW